MKEGNDENEHDKKINNSGNESGMKQGQEKRG
jgi:hypothetical protein